jgi:hypothetical protein
MPRAAAQACASNVRQLALPLRAEAAARALAAASCHADASRALELAASLCATLPGAHALAACDSWIPACEPLLKTPPATEEDRVIWQQLLRVVHRAVLADSTSILAPGSSTAASVRFTTLALCLAQSAPPLLSAPQAAQPPRALPIALAGFGATPSAAAPSPHRPRSAPMAGLLAHADGSSDPALQNQNQLAMMGSEGRGQRLMVQVTRTLLQTLAALLR